MGITHIKDGEGFFGGEHAATHRDFGFSGSAAEVPRVRFAKGGQVTKGKPPFAKQTPADGIEQMHDSSELAHRVRKASGGSMNDTNDDVLYGSMERDPVTGSLRGVTVSRTKQQGKNADDGLRKANGGGVQVPTGAPFPEEPTSMPRQVNALGTAGVAMAKGGHADAAQDRALISKMLKQHESGEGDRMGKARGGRATLPKAMKAKALQSHSPINTPPRNPTTTTTPRNIMPGGAMAYGVQPSSEPAVAGSGQGIPQLADGGRVRMGALRGTY